VSAGTLILSVGRPPGREWKRRPGRSRARWIDQVRRDLNTSPVELWRRAVYDVVMVLERRNGPCRLRDHDDIDDDDDDDDVILFE